MLAHRFSVIVLAAAFLCGLAPPSRAQSDAAVAADARQIEDELRAFRDANQKDAVKRVLDDLRANMATVDACLASGANGGFLAVGIGMGCYAVSKEHLMQSLLAAALAGELKEQDIGRKFVEIAQTSAQAAKALRAQRAEMQREYDQTVRQLTSCPLAGTYHNQLAGGGASDWTVDAQGTARESGLGNAIGNASIAGHTLMIQWQTDSGYTGYYRIELDDQCRAGSGQMTQTKVPPGVAPSTLASSFARQGAGSPQPAAAAAGPSPYGGCMIQSSNSCAYTTAEGCASFKGRFCGASPTNPCHPVNGINSC
jgi:hypothetical protein